MNQDERLGLPSASAMERIMQCPGSFLAERMATFEAPAAAGAERGSLVHLAAELGNPLIAPEAEVWENLKNEALERWQNDIQELTNEPISAEEGPREQRLYLYDNELSPIFSGRIDQHFLCGSRALLIDGKTGYVAPDPNSWQMRSLAVLLRLEYGVSTVRAALLLIDKKRVAWTDFDANSLDYFERRIRDALHAADTNPVRCAGEWCRYCRARTDCAEAIALAQLPVAYTGMPATKKEAEAKVALLPPDSLAAIWKKHTIIEAILNAVQERLRSMDDETLASIGLTRQKGRTIRTIADPAGMVAHLHEVGMDTEMFAPALSFSYSKLLEMYARFRGMEETQAANVWDDLMLTETKQAAQPIVAQKSQRSTE